MSQAQSADGHIAAPELNNSPRRVLLASMIGTTIEFFDFYAYATAAVIVFPRLFFPAADAFTATLQSFATFSLAFFARPIGAVVFGHFGDRIGRKATLVAALLTMGLSTVAIGLLPTYDTIGIAAPALLALCRFGQGLGLGGEWGGAVLMATENAPPGKRSFYAIFPQLGAPLGFLLSVGTLLLLSAAMPDAAFLAYGWRIPFVASLALVGVGIYVRTQILETASFQRVVREGRVVRYPLAALMRTRLGVLSIAILASMTTLLLFYLMTVFPLSWATAQLGYSRDSFLMAQLASNVVFAIAILVSGLLADSFGRRRMMLLTTAGILLFGCAYGWLLSGGPLHLGAFLVIGMWLMGMTYGPIGAALAGVFPGELRYTGASLAFNFAGILGASVAPFFATWIATSFDLSFVGYYLALSAFLSFVGFAVLADVDK